MDDVAHEPPAGSASPAEEVALPMVGIGLRYQRGIDDLSQWGAVDHFQCVTFTGAMLTRWGGDAHCVTYSVTDPEGRTLPSFPRLRKVGPVVEQLRGQAHEVSAWGFMLDYDNPDHGVWRPGQQQEFEQRLAEASQDVVVGAASLFYYTRAGARVVYLLDKPVPVGEESEAMHRAVVRAWACSGIRIDPACSDWTRMFRLPLVTRDD